MFRPACALSAFVQINFLLIFRKFSDSFAGERSFSLRIDMHKLLSCRLSELFRYRDCWSSNFRVLKLAFPSREAFHTL